MSELLGSSGMWWLGTALGGGIVLLLASLAMWRAPNATARQRVGELGIAAALLLAALRLAPSWLYLPDPWPAPVPRPPIAAALPVPQQQPEPPEFAMAPMPVELQRSPMVVTDVRPNIVPPVVTATIQPQSSPAPPAAASAPVIPPSFVNALLAGYLCVAGFFVARWFVGQIALWRIVARARPAPEPVQQVFDRLAVERGQCQARLLVSERVPVPMCCGMRRPTVVIPRSLALENETTVLRWVLTHELTHLERRDPWSTCMCALAQAIYFYLPWYWWMRRQVRLCQEYVADAAAAAQGRWADEYANYLVSLARCPAAPAGATGVLGNTTDLFRRVTMVLQQSSTGREWSRRKLFSGAACLIASAVILAGLGVRAESPNADGEKKKANVTAEEKDGQVQVKVVVVDDEDKDKDKKDGDKKKDAEKKEIKKRVIVADGAGFHKMDKADIEKKVRTALENAKLSDEQIEKIVKELTKSMEQVHVQLGQMPALGAFGGGQSGTFTLQPHGDLFTTVGGGQGRLGVMAEKPGSVLADQLELPKDQGLVITQVVKGSAAEKAGIKAHDVILKFAGKNVPSDSAKLVKIIADAPADKELDAVVLRKGKKETISGITLAEKKSPEDQVKVFRFGDGEDGKGGVAIARALQGAGEHSSNKTVTVMVKDGEYTAKEVDGDLSITVTGSVDNGKVDVASVSINDSDGKTKYNSLDKVPSKYRDRVKKLIANTGDSSIRFDSRKEKSDR